MIGRRADQMVALPYSAKRGGLCLPRFREKEIFVQISNVPNIPQQSIGLGPLLARL